MADENKPMKYLSYAIGEIGLVVIWIKAYKFKSQFQRDVPKSGI